jgi:tRNA(Ser,Leu) C12 N-acetylase TAN1
MALTGTTSKGKDHATAAKELKLSLGQRAEAAASERAFRELVSAKGDVEYGVNVITQAKAEPLVRRARSLVELAVQIVRLGR